MGECKCAGCRDAVIRSCHFAGVSELCGLWIELVAKVRYPLTIFLLAPSTLELHYFQYELLLPSSSVPSLFKARLAAVVTVQS